jgi:SAM-dependent methyltransferase
LPGLAGSQNGSYHPKRGKSMLNYREETYGELMAGVYDQWYESCDSAAITALNRLARGGRALELGIGTGRIALPLHHSGIEVHGLDASESMVARLRMKPGGDKIPVTIGTFADMAVEGQYELVFVVFNTIFALLTQEEQVRCFRNVAQHLCPTGVFLIEAFVPDLARFSDRQAVRIASLGENEARLDASQHDQATQQITVQHIFLSHQEVRLYPIKLRYAWPAEFDLMARLAGLRLKERWGDWQGEPFSSHSVKHISIYEHGE